MLASGTLAGYPRIYELAITLISHSEARVDVDNLGLFVAAFQEKATLAIGEQWAIPAMLRLALIESVRRMALRTMQRMDDVEQADAWAARIDAAAASDGDGALGAVLDRFVDAPPRLSPVLISRFLRQLRQSSDGSSRLAHVEQWISDRALSAEDATARSTQHLALTQIIMAHSITSLRAITHIDWHGTLASPASLAGAVQMSGTATMVPGNDARTTKVSLDLANAAPGGVHPWALHRGQCDYDEGRVGQRSSYQDVKVDRDGRASTTAEVALHTPTSGRYSVWVTASAANSDMVVACANLAPPSR